MVDNIWIHWNITAKKLLDDTNAILLKSKKSNELIANLDVNDNVNKIMALIVDDYTEYSNMCSVIGFTRICKCDEEFVNAIPTAEQLLFNHVQSIISNKKIYKN